jgi:hypothetical protein
VSILLIFTFDLLKPNFSTKLKKSNLIPEVERDRAKDPSEGVSEILKDASTDGIPNQKKVTTPNFIPLPKSKKHR